MTCERQSPEIRILIVDDVALVRLSLRKILEKEGYGCLEAADGEEALRLLEQEPVPLMLCDIHMPGKNGLEVVQNLQSRIPDVSIVMVSAVEETETAIECLQLGAFGYVHKPFQAREILVQVNAALRRRMLEIEHRDRERVLAGKVREQTQEIRESREEVALRLISASEARDRETGAHVRRIGLFAAEMATLLGWSQLEVDAIQSAAPMHDIGKVGVPDAILQKPGPLTDSEWAIMRQHTTMGARILKGSKVKFLQMAARIAACHHERWDGTGYPNGLRGEAIPIEARITGLVDVYDALCNRRHYKESWPEEQVIEFLKEGRGTHFDPALLDLFLGNLGQIRKILDANQDASEEEEFTLPEGF
jgi:putative two-component system response regulator